MGKGLRLESERRLNHIRWDEKAGLQRDAISSR